jgi:outer membrane protein assembly factor BamB
LWEHDLGLTFTASPTTAGGRLFLVATDGMTVIVDLADEFREIARYPLGDEVHASPVLGDGWILLRGKHWLWRIGGGQP